MAVLPQFDPAQAPDTLAKLSLQSQSAQQSWMDQAQSRQLQAQQGDRTQKIFEAAMPALMAQKDAEQATAQAKLQNMAIVQRFRQQSANDGPAATAEFLDVANTASNEDGSPDWESQYQALNSIQAKYSGLALLPEYKPLVEQISAAKKSAYDMAMKHTVAQEALDRANAAVQGRLQGIADTNATRLALGNDTNKTREDVATIGAGARTGSAGISAGAKTNVEQLKVWDNQAHDADVQAAAEQDPARKAALQKRADSYRGLIDKASLKANQAAPAVALPVIKTALPATEAQHLAPGTVFKGEDGKWYRTRAPDQETTMEQPATEQ